MITIELTASELHQAALVGSTRQFEASLRNRVNAHGMSDNPWQGLANHICGACGEIAVAKLLGVYWGAEVNSFKGPDLNGSSIQVRTRREHHRELIVRTGDNDTDRFYLVTGLAPSLCVRGWILGRNAKRPEWFRGHGNREPAYFVPQSELLEDKSL